MAIELGAAYISILPSTSRLAPELTKSLKSVEGKVGGEKSGQGIGSRLASGVGSALKKGAIGAGLAAGGLIGTSLVKGFGRLNAIDQAEAKLRGLGHSAKGVSGIMANALASVKGTAFGLDEAATTAGAVVAAGIKPGKQLEGVLKTVADTATIAGTSMSDMGAIFGSVAARGKLQGDDLLQLQSKGVPVLAFLAKHYKITTKAASEMVTKGKVDFKNFAAAMHENIGGAALDSGKTVQGAWKNLWASISRIGANVLSGIFPKLQGAFTGLTKFLGPVEDRAKVFGQKVGSGIKIATDAVKTFVNAFRGKGDVGGKFMVPMIEAGVKARAIFDRLKTTVNTAFGYITKNVVPVVVSGFKGLWDAAQPIGPALVRIGKALAPIFQSSGKSAKDSGPGILAAAFGLLRLAVKGLAAILSGVADFAENHGTAFRRMAVGIAAATAATWLGIKAYRAGKAAMAAYRAVVATMRAVQVGYAAGSYGAAGATYAVGTAQKVGAVSARVFAVATRLVGAALRFAMGPVGLIITGLTLLGAGLVLLFKRNKTFHNLVISVWNGVKATVSAVVKWFTGTAWPWMKRFFQDVGDKAQWLWRNVLKPTFGFIKSAWDTTAKAVRDAWRNIIKPAWDSMKSAVSAMWNKVLKPTFTTLTKAWLDVAGAIVRGAAKAFGWVPGIGPKLRKAADKFDTFRDQVNKSLAGIRDRHVDIVTAYNIKGPSANQQAAKLAGMGYASGGTVAGAPRAPYGDKVLTHLAPGEEVISNRRGQADRYRGLLKAINAGRQIPGFASGGTVFDVRTRGLNTTAAKFESLAEDVNSVMGKLAAGLKSKLMGVVSRMFGGASGPHIGGSWRGLWDMVKSHFPSAILTSAFRPGARTPFGNLSRHGMGKAIDIAPSKAIWDWLYPMRGRLFELLGPWGMFREGRPWYSPITAAMHKNHIHLSSYADGGTVRPQVFDQGGVLAPGINVVRNDLGRPEHLVRADQQRGQRPIIIQGNVGWDPHRVAREIETKERDAMALAGVR